MLIHYSNPGQLKEYNQFLTLDNADGSLCFCDPENETNLKYHLYKDGVKVKRTILYVKQLSFDDFWNELTENFTKTKCYTLIFCRFIFIIGMMN